jgi:Putative peptidoglycan binding domain
MSAIAQLFSGRGEKTDRAAGWGRVVMTGMVAGAVGLIAISAAIMTGSIGAYAAGVVSEAPEVETNPALIREIQFMLLRLGMDPGPIDGIAGPQTLKAVHKFQEQSNLPFADLVNNGKISTALLARLRGEASRVILGNESKPEASTGSPTAATPPAVAAAPVEPARPPPDRFAACSFNPQDFRIGATQYTPEKFLQEGFDGSTVRAVANLKERLDEARQLAENIGGSALTEVQRQARVLNYFTCRLKIEQASTKN